MSTVILAVVTAIAYTHGYLLTNGPPRPRSYDPQLTDNGQQAAAGRGQSPYDPQSLFHELQDLPDADDFLEPYFLDHDDDSSDGRSDSLSTYDAPDSFAKAYKDQLDSILQSSDGQAYGHQSSVDSPYSQSLYTDESSEDRSSSSDRSHAGSDYPPEQFPFTDSSNDKLDKEVEAIIDLYGENDPSRYNLDKYYLPDEQVYDLLGHLPAINDFGTSRKLDSDQDQNRPLVSSDDNLDTDVQTLQDKLQNQDELESLFENQLDEMSKQFLSDENRNTFPGKSSFSLQPMDVLTERHAPGSNNASWRYQTAPDRERTNQKHPTEGSQSESTNRTSSHGAMNETNLDLNSTDGNKTHAQEHSGKNCKNCSRGKENHASKKHSGEKDQVINEHRGHKHTSENVEQVNPDEVILTKNDSVKSNNSSEDEDSFDKNPEQVDPDEVTLTKNDSVKSNNSSEDKDSFDNIFEKFITDELIVIKKGSVKSKDHSKDVDQSDKAVSVSDDINSGNHSKDQENQSSSSEDSDENFDSKSTLGDEDGQVENGDDSRDRADEFSRENAHESEASDSLSAETNKINKTSDNQKDPDKSKIHSSGLDRTRTVKYSDESFSKRLGDLIRKRLDTIIPDAIEELNERAVVLAPSSRPSSPKNRSSNATELHGVTAHASSENSVHMKNDSEYRQKLKEDLRKLVEKYNAMQYNAMQKREKTATLEKTGSVEDETRNQTGASTFMESEKENDRNETETDHQIGFSGNQTQSNSSTESHDQKDVDQKNQDVSRDPGSTSSGTVNDTSGLRSNDEAQNKSQNISNDTVGIETHSGPSDEASSGQTEIPFDQSGDHDFSLSGDTSDQSGTTLDMPYVSPFDKDDQATDSSEYGLQEPLHITVPGHGHAFLAEPRYRPDEYSHSPFGHRTVQNPSYEPYDGHDYGVPDNVPDLAGYELRRPDLKRHGSHQMKKLHKYPSSGLPRYHFVRPENQELDEQDYNRMNHKTSEPITADPSHHVAYDGSTFKTGGKPDYTAGPSSHRTSGLNHEAYPPFNDYSILDYNTPDSQRSGHRPSVAARDHIPPISASAEHPQDEMLGLSGPPEISVMPDYKADTALVDAVYGETGGPGFSVYAIPDDKHSTPDSEFYSSSDDRAAGKDGPKGYGETVSDEYRPKYGHGHYHVADAYSGHDSRIMNGLATGLDYSPKKDSAEKDSDQVSRPAMLDSPVDKAQGDERNNSDGKLNRTATLGEPVDEAVQDFERKRNGEVNGTAGEDRSVDRTAEEDGSVDRTAGEDRSVDRTAGEDGSVDRTAQGFPRKSEEEEGTAALDSPMDEATQDFDRKNNSEGQGKTAGLEALNKGQSIAGAKTVKIDQAQDKDEQSIVGPKTVSLKQPEDKGLSVLGIRSKLDNPQVPVSDQARNGLRYVGPSPTPYLGEFVCPEGSFLSVIRSWVNREEWSFIKGIRRYFNFTCKPLPNLRRKRINTVCEWIGPTRRFEPYSFNCGSQAVVTGWRTLQPVMSVDFTMDFQCCVITSRRGKILYTLTHCQLSGPVNDEMFGFTYQVPEGQVLYGVRTEPTLAVDRQFIFEYCEPLPTCFPRRRGRRPRLHLIHDGGARIDA